jgi:hypothetical protein
LSPLIKVFFSSSVVFYTQNLNVSSEFKGFKLLADPILSHRQMTYAKAAGICWGEEERTVVVVVVVGVVVPAEIRNTGSWCIKLLRPNHMPSHNKKQNQSLKT